MAEDVICLLDYLGWTGERELNIIGISLGGMIAQGLLSSPLSQIPSQQLVLTSPLHCRTRIPHPKPHLFPNSRRNDSRRVSFGQLSFSMHPLIFTLLLDVNLLKQWRGFSSLFKLTFTSDPSKKVEILLNVAFSEKWLLEKAESDPYAEQNGNIENKMGKTNYDVEKEVS